MTVFINKLPDSWPPILGCDIETSHLSPYLGNLLSVALSDGKDVWLFFSFHDLSPIRSVLEDERIIKIFHNAKFEISWFKRQFLSLFVNNIYDTMVAEQVLDGGMGMPMGLDDLLARNLGVFIDKEERETFFEHPGFDNRPITNSQLDYIANDVVYLPKLREQQLIKISDLRLGAVVDTEFACIDAFSELELRGLTLDVDGWYMAAQGYSLRLQELEAEMRHLIGLYTLSVPSIQKGVETTKEYVPSEINMGSPKQLLSLLNNRFSLSVPNTREATLQEALLEADGEAERFLQALLEHRKVNKRLGFDYPKFINPVTGKVHPNFHQLGAGTGRVSCSEPNLQQVPRPTDGEPNLRRIWKADTPNHKIVCADYNQQEPRIMAQMSGDKAMIVACNTEDVYVEFARHMYGKEIKKGSEERHIAKTFVLAVGYAAGANALHRSSKLPIDECQRIRSLINRRFPQMVLFAEKMDRQLQTYGYVTTGFGRRRYFPDKQMRRFSQGVNTVIQGTAADMFKIALADVHRRLTHLKKTGKIEESTRVWHVVHDEIVLHCAESEVPLISDLIKTSMLGAGHRLCPDVSHFVEISVGDAWDK